MPTALSRPDYFRIRVNGLPMNQGLCTLQGFAQDQDVIHTLAEDQTH
jgi:hypothetical protein